MRSKRDADVIHVQLGIAPTVAFGNVRRNRHGCASKLRGEAVQLFTRKGACGFVAMLDELHCGLPRVQLSISGGRVHVAMTRICCAATNSSNSHDVAGKLAPACYPRG